MFCVKYKKIVNLWDIIKDNLGYKSKSRKVSNFSESSVPIASVRDIYEGHLSLKDTDDGQSNLAIKIKNLDKGKKKTKKQLNYLETLKEK